MKSSRWFAPAIALAGLLILLPGLGAFGLWDPYEVRMADAVQAMVQSPSWSAPQMARTPAGLWPIGLGFQRIGVNELGGRLPLAILAVLALLLTYAAAQLFTNRPRAALFGAGALLVSPSFFLGARQLTLGILPVFATALILVGVAMSEGDDKPGPLRQALGWLLTLAGALLGTLASGIFIGAVAPAVAIAILFALSGKKTGAISTGVVAAAFAIVGALAFRDKAFSFLLTGTPRPFSHGTVGTTYLKQLGFAVFPWGVLVPFAAARALSTRARAPMFLLAWAIACYLGATLTAAGVADLLAPLAPMVCLLVGWFLDQLLDETEPLPFLGFAVATLALLVGRDMFANPELYIGAHMLETVRWPTAIPAIPNLLMAFAGAWAGLVGLAIGAPLSRRAQDEEMQRRGRALLFGTALVASVAFALITTQWIIPTLSKHLSSRDLYGKTRALDPNAPIGQFRFNATGASYYSGGKKPETLNSLTDLFTFLARPERVFVMVGADELASIDQTSRLQKAAYVVIDNTNSHYLILSNRLGANEKDVNPLKTLVTDAPPTMKTPVSIDFDGKVELIGYDIPETAERGAEWKVKLYFKVLQPLASSYKVFMHFDGPGLRINGDHTPMAGRFPTQFWVPGTYVTDEHIMRADRATQSAGRYQVFMGMFAGDKRLKVLTGDHDGDNRVKLGAVQIK